MAERRARTSYYLGPGVTIRRGDLQRYDDSGEWVAEVKHDGVWCMMTVDRGVATGFESRTGSALDAGFLNQRIAGAGTGLVAGELVSDTVDGEDGESSRTGTKRLYLFEPIIWNGLDLRDLALEDRREALKMVAGTFDRDDADDGSPLVRVVERRDAGFLAWYDALMAAGATRIVGERPEGIVLKRRGSRGRAANADGKVDFQVRCKPLNTVDYVVIGPDGEAEKGTPKVALGLYKKLPGGRRELVFAMSPSWPRGMDLPPGTVVEVEGADVFSSGATRHGGIKRVRADKRAEDCTYEAAVAAGGSG